MVDVNQKAQAQGTQAQSKEKKEKRPRMYDTLAIYNYE